VLGGPEPSKFKHNLSCWEDNRVIVHILHEILLFVVPVLLGPRSSRRRDRNQLATLSRQSSRPEGKALLQYCIWIWRKETVAQLTKREGIHYTTHEIMHPKQREQREQCKTRGCLISGADHSVTRGKQLSTYHAGATSKMQNYIAPMG
jgi:hypothetical protein